MIIRKTMKNHSIYSILFIHHTFLLFVYHLLCFQENMITSQYKLKQFESLWIEYLYALFNLLIFHCFINDIKIFEEQSKDVCIQLHDITFSDKNR